MAVGEKFQRVVLLAGLLAMAIPLYVAAQTSPQEKPAEMGKTQEGAQRNWRVSCSDDGAEGNSQCRMVQTLAMRQTGQRLLTVILQVAATDPKPRMVIGLPHGVYFPEGVTVAVGDAQPLKLTVQTSDADGAYAITEVGDTLLGDMRRGEILTVGFQSGNRQPISIPVPLQGFEEAYKRVSSFGG